MIETTGAIGLATGSPTFFRIRLLWAQLRSLTDLDSCPICRAKWSSADVEPLRRAKAFVSHQQQTFIGFASAPALRAKRPVERDVCNTQNWRKTCVELPPGPILRTVNVHVPPPAGD